MDHTTAPRGAPRKYRQPVPHLRSGKVWRPGLGFPGLVWNWPGANELSEPMANGVAERWVRSFRNEVLDHVIVLNEGHLRRMAQDYLCYYHQDRTHDGLTQDPPANRQSKAGMLASGFNRYLTWVVFTIDIVGQKVHERCSYNFGDVQGYFVNELSDGSWNVSLRSGIVFPIMAPYCSTLSESSSHTPRRLATIKLLKLHGSLHFQVTHSCQNLPRFSFPGRHRSYIRPPADVD
jgi:hypothetical protein